MKTIKTILFFSLLLFFIDSSFACRCKQASIIEAIQFEDYIVSGKVIEILETFPALSNNMGFSVKVRINKIYKGEVRSDTIVIDSGKNSCSYFFRLNEEYLFLGSCRNGSYFTDECTRTDLLKDNKDIEILEKHFELK